ncbi:CaiB/BaiF CoA transferase family protein [Chloroflexota bacterium]
MTSALEGIKVIEAASAVGGPMAGRLLADWGADVIHIESAAGHFATQEPTRYRGDISSEINYISQNTSCNKRGMALDLSKEVGRKIIYKLLESADVFLSNFRPRELVKFQLEYDTLSKLNPRLICATLTGYGREGPEKNTPGYGATGADPRSGLIHMLTVPGQDPPETPVAYADFVSGMTLAYGIMTALLIRERTGVAQEVDASLYNSVVWALTSSVGGALVTGKDGEVVRRRDKGTALRNSYQTKDGRWLFLAIIRKDAFWSQFCKAIEREDLKHDPRFEPPRLSKEDNTTLFDILEDVFKSRTLTEWKPRLDEVGAPWSHVQNLIEVVNDPQARANDFFVPLKHPVHGEVEIVANPAKLSKTPATVRKPAPEVGQDTEEILGEIGYTPEEINEFVEQQVIII